MCNSSTMVSIACITYNQDKYIRQTLDGFVSQRTNFQIEIVIHDDASTDSTPNIIQEYIDNYPDIKWVPIFQKTNKYKDGCCSILASYVFPNCSGKYIALCEGDDYWIDPLKLQKQVDFMENNKEYSICYHHVRILNAKTNSFESDNNLYEGIPENFSIMELATRNCIHTPSVLYRNNSDIWNKVLKMGPSVVTDYAFHMFAAEKGLIKRLPDIMGVYRQGVGIWSNEKVSVFDRETEWLFSLSKISVLLDDPKVKAIIEEQIKKYKLDIQKAYLSLTQQIHQVRSSNEFRIGYMLTKRFRFLSNLIITIGNRHKIKNTLI